MTAVEPDGRLRRLAQLPGIGPVVHDAEMLIVPAGVAGRPPDNGQIIDGYFEGRLFCDLDVRRLPSGRQTPAPTTVHLAFGLGAEPGRF